MKIFKIIALCLGLIFCLTVAANAQQIADDAKTADTTIPRNSKIYIAPMDGFETYLAAAIRKKEVPVILVSVPDAADFQIDNSRKEKCRMGENDIYGRRSRLGVSFDADYKC
jgi:hypothetical protein